MAASFKALHRESQQLRSCPVKSPDIRMAQIGLPRWPHQPAPQQAAAPGLSAQNQPEAFQLSLVA